MSVCCHLTMMKVVNVYDPKYHNCRTNIVFIRIKKIEKTDYVRYIRGKQFEIFVYPSVVVPV